MEWQTNNQIYLHPGVQNIDWIVKYCGTLLYDCIYLWSPDLSLYLCGSKYNSAYI